MKTLTPKHGISATPKTKSNNKGHQQNSTTINLPYQVMKIKTPQKPPKSKHIRNRSNQQNINSLTSALINKKKNLTDRPNPRPTLAPKPRPTGLPGLAAKRAVSTSKADLPMPWRAWMVFFFFFILKNGIFFCF